MRIAITDINPKTLSHTREAILSINPSVQIFHRPGDISDESFIDSFHEEAFSKFSRLDYAVNCAGVLGSKTLKAVEMETDAFDRLNRINYRRCLMGAFVQMPSLKLTRRLMAKLPGSVEEYAQAGTARWAAKTKRCHCEHCESIGHSWQTWSW